MQLSKIRRRYLSCWRLVGSGLVLAACARGGQAPAPPSTSVSEAPPSELSPVDILVFAPHPDDEILGCGGVLQQAVAAGKRARVVFATSGDGYPYATATLLDKDESALVSDDFLVLTKTRQQEALDAARSMGLSSANLVFLGYPDGALAKVAANTTATPVTSPTTARSATYGVVARDYHTSAHGRAAPYDRASAVADFTEVLAQSRPSRVYVTSATDSHPDHAATNALAKAAIAASGYHGEVFTFVVHSGPPSNWPWPSGATPEKSFQPHTVDGVIHPKGLPWPPSVRIPLTARESSQKLEAMTIYHSQWVLKGDHELFESFIKSEEIFWTGQ